MNLYNTAFKALLYTLSYVGKKKKKQHRPRCRDDTQLREGGVSCDYAAGLGSVAATPSGWKGSGGPTLSSFRRKQVNALEISISTVCLSTQKDGRGPCRQSPWPGGSRSHPDCVESQLQPPPLCQQTLRNRTEGGPSPVSNCVPTGDTATPGCPSKTGRRPQVPTGQH